MKTRDRLAGIRINVGRAIANYNRNEHHDGSGWVVDNIEDGTFTVRTMVSGGDNKSWAKLPMTYVFNALCNRKDPIAKAIFDSETHSQGVVTMKFKPLSPVS